MRYEMDGNISVKQEMCCNTKSRIRFNPFQQKHYFGQEMFPPLSIWSNDLWCEGEISDSVITFMASYSPEHSDTGIDHSDPLGCHSRKVGNRVSDSFCLCCPPPSVFRKISCAAFRQEAQQYLGNEWDRDRAAA
ncbi:hypothetical protein CDAR_177671 [Caerostris darwini]|uniref:Uncharacterized protein n=1 Tax=Caerostris darwini TaxID=1538125 RepID=A0AAV4P452_9ARAC|nr:hypothetical protein CDAR_177671 [Caerostris darwini]